MKVRFIDAEGAHLRDPDDLVELFGRIDGFFWIDVVHWDDEATAVLEGLGCHEMLIQQCQQRNYVPKVHTYDDHVFVIALSPMLGGGGHVHLLELDQIIAQRFIVTVHGPVNPSLDISHALVETSGVLRRIDEGRFRPTTPIQLSYAITSAVARRQSTLVGAVAAKLPGLEKEVMDSQLIDPEALLETMFLIRHELITARTMAAQCHEIWARMAGLGRLTDDPDGRYAKDLAEQFDRVRSIADGESQFLFGVIELYQTKVHTKMTVAMERLAVIAAVTLPVTAIASVVGMNVIVNDATHWGTLTLLLVAMLAISALLLRWAKRQGWW